MADIMVLNDILQHEWYLIVYFLYHKWLLIFILWGKELFSYFYLVELPCQFIAMLIEE